MSVSENMKHLRKRFKITQNELAERLKISPSTVAMYERGYREPNIEMLQKMADIFSVDINYLLGYKPKDNPTEEPKLTDGESAIIELFRQASPHHQEMILRMIEAAVTPKE
jgi:transcriptional regulator with XRE-family HTH domain